MPHYPSKHRHKLTALAFAVQMLMGSAHAAESVQTASELAVRIPAQPLGQALNALAAKTGWFIGADAALVRGKQAPALEGNYSPEAALRALLDGSGLRYRITQDRTVIIERSAPAAATVPASRPAGQSAPAQPSEPEVLALGDIIVTGEKFDRKLEETLSSVAVATAADIASHADQTLTDVMMRTPGVYTQSGNENWGIRGVPVSGFDAQGAGTMNGAVTVFVDGASQPHRRVTLSPLDLWDVEQVEVFRGSQSTTQGRNSLAGAVVVKTKDPVYHPEFIAQANVGRFGERGGSLVANGVLVEGTAAARLAVDYQTEDGYIRNDFLGTDANPRRELNVRGKLLLQPTERLDVLFTLARDEHRSGSQAVDAEAGRPDYYKLTLNTEEKDELDQNTAIAKLDYYLSDAWTFTSLTSGSWMTYRAVLDFDQGIDREREAVRKHEQNLASQEFRLSYEADRLNGFLGVYYGRHTNDIVDKINLKLGGIEDPALVVNGDVLIRNTAVFGEAHWTFADRWQLFGGLRYDHESNDTRFDYTDPLGFATVPNADVSASSNEWLPKIGISHEIVKGHLIGLEYKRGYRGGGVDLSTSTAHLPYDPEYTNTYELSWRGAWLDKRLSTRANLYHTDWKDQQVEVPDADGIGFVANAARARMRGLEFDADYRMTSNLQLFMGASIIDTRYLDFIYDGQDVSGQEFPFAPDFKLTLGGSYRFANGLRVGADVVHQSDSITRVLNDDGLLVERPNDSVTLVNFSASYKVRDTVSISAYAKNLFDRRYITNNQEADGTMDVGAPRTVGVSVRLDL